MKLLLNRRRANAGAIVGIAAIMAFAVIMANQQAGKRTRQVSAVNIREDVLGESFNAQNLSLTLESVQSYQVDDSTATRRVAAKVLITNISNQVLQIAPGLQMSVTDGSGRSHMATARHLADGEVIGGPVQPGYSITINADFDVPAEDIPYEFIFQYDAAADTVNIQL